jgi:phosphoribosylformimino-5-aminoimidazole carboxamide ribotide isomerase
MLIIPAIDLQEGKAVRLTKGVMTSAIVYSDNPLRLAGEFMDAGVARLHLVDLDGAKTGNTSNISVIEKIAKLGMQLEVGGGIRDMNRAKHVFNIGASFVIVGTAAVKDKDFVLALAENYPGKVILAIDARDGFASTNGWNVSSEIKAAELAAEYKNAAIESVIYTDIERDGTLSGINLQGLAAFAALSPFKVIASGGVSCLEDIDGLNVIPNIFGVIVGKAVYEKKIALSEIVCLKNV